MPCITSVAIGETGLDYHYQPETAALQKTRFEQQVEVAVEVNKPLIIHTRNAREDTLAILKNGSAEKWWCHTLFYRRFAICSGCDGVRLLHLYL